MRKIWTKDYLETVEQVGRRFGVAPQEILGPFRDQRIVVARHAAFSELRDAGLTLPRIAKVMNRDHTTVMYGIRRHAERSGAAA